MVTKQTAHKIRKTHRYLGLFLGIQFLCWTSSGIYFSWTDIDNIHGDHFKNTEYQPAESDTNVSESYTCEDCGIDLPLPEPNEDSLRGEDR